MGPDACSRVRPGSKPLRRVTSIPIEDDGRRGERRRSSASPEPFLTASASVGTSSRGRNRSAWRRILRQETEVASNRDVELTVNFNCDRTAPGKGPSGAFVDRAAKYSVGSDAGRADARLAVTSELSRGISPLRHPTTQCCGGGGDSRNQPKRRQAKAPSGSPTNG